ncbi:MAG: alpha/beta fold hydrolase [bacterium]
MSRVMPVPALRRRLLLCCALVVTGAPASAQQDQSRYQQSVEAIGRRQAVDDSIAAAGARSILLTTGAPTARAILLLHGLTDSPRQFEAFAHLLYADGNNVYVPRLPQHGLRGKDAGALGALTVSQLRGVADSVVDEVRGLGDSVVVVGLSMGGTIGAWIAQARDVTRVILIAPAIEPGRIPSLLDRPLIGLADHLPSLTRRSQPDAARPDREPGFSLHAVAEVLELGRSLLNEAAQVPSRTRDVTLLVNASDRTVKASAAEALGERWLHHGAAVSVFELPDSLRLPHNIIDPFEGHGGGDAVLAVLRDLTYGREPSALVRRLSLR